MSKYTRKEFPHGPGTFTGSYDTEALTGSMDSVLTVGLSRAARKAAQSSGDFVDQGLVLIRELEREGFEVRLTPPQHTGA